MESPNLSGPNLANASAIKANAEKLLEDQRYRSELEHTLQNAYLDLSRLAGKTAADDFVVSLVRLPF